MLWRNEKMKIIISPAKQMRTDLEGMAPVGLPVFLEEANTILTVLRSMALARNIPRRMSLCS